MAIGVFKLNQKQRNILSTIFVSLNIIQVVTGVIMVILSIYIYVSVAPVLYSERAEISYVFMVIGICGFNNICNYIFGVKIRQKCMNQSYKKSTRTLVFAWTCVSFYIIIYLIILAKMTRKIYKHMIRAMGHSLHIGMTKYLKENLWKLTIDKIQYDLQCCGAQSYKEWHEISWLNKYVVNEKSESVKQFHDTETWNLPVTPWSCCRISFPMQCLHDPLQQIRSLTVWTDQPSLVLESINTEGCLNKLKIPIRSALITFVLLVAVNCIVQTTIFFVLRILYTSCRNAILLNDAEGVAPGWIFGRGDCGYNRGKTLGELMYSEGRHKSEENFEQFSRPTDAENKVLDNDENQRRDN